jgi:hypothetical protein
MRPRHYEVADDDEAIELFHRNGWTDGLPIVPPTEARVARLLAAAGAPQVTLAYPADGGQAEASQIKGAFK